jgi:hypothetical protein
VALSRLPDDIGQSLAGAGRMVAGEPVSAIFNYSGDHDWFRMAVVAGHTYSVKLSAPGGTISPSFAVAADGAAIKELRGSWGSGYETLVFKAMASGDVLLKASSWSPVGYTIAPTVIGIDDHGDTPAQATPLAIGSSTRAGLDLTTDVDVFRFSLEAGVSYVFKAIDAPASTRVAGQAPNPSDRSGAAYTVTPQAAGDH